MLTRLVIRNFKLFGKKIEIELGNPVVFIGPNNSGKTSALQAIALWHLGVSRWASERSKGRKKAVAISRSDLVSVPVPSARLLWKDLHVRDMKRSGGKLKTKNVRIEITLEGITGEKSWKCGMEFDFSNQETIFCRRLGALAGSPALIPEEAKAVRVAFLPPMSGLSSREDKLEPGSINVRVGEGRTAEVLRNLCYQVSENENKGIWAKLVGQMEELFGVRLEKPVYLPERGEITMAYREQGVRLDISSSGRGFQQTLLVLSYLYANPGAVLLVDEPDAHLEFLRQRQIYQIISDVSRETGSQVIMASHSEVLLNEAADRDVLVAFLYGEAHRVDDRGSQVLKALKSIGFEHYLQARQTGWVLYLEGSTDLAVLRAFARTLEHPAARHLERPFVHYVGNHPTRVWEHFFALKKVKDDLVGVAIFDRLDSPPKDFGQKADQGLLELMWERREIENYLCYPDVLLAYARGEAQLDLFKMAGEKIMKGIVEDLVPPRALQDLNDPWWENVKASDEFLDRVFEEYFDKIGLPNLMRKTDYHRLASLVPRDMIHQDIKDKLDAIHRIAEKAKKR